MAESGEFYVPPTTHFIATVEDLTDMLDYASEDIDGMDDDAGDDSEPPLMGRWTATSSYDIYMVDTPKENEADGDNNMSVDEPPKCRRPNADLDPAKGKTTTASSRTGYTQRQMDQGPGCQRIRP